MIKKEEIERIIRSRVEIPETFVIGDIIRRPNNWGCVEIKGGWYIYRVDDRGGCTFTGPFDDKAIIYACAQSLRVAKMFSEYKFSDEDRDKYIDVHLLFDEI